jgi:hypothetical protein
MARCGGHGSSKGRHGMKPARSVLTDLVRDARQAACRPRRKTHEPRRGPMHVSSARAGDRVPATAVVYATTNARHRYGAQAARVNTCAASASHYGDEGPGTLDRPGERPVGRLSLPWLLLLAPTVTGAAQVVGTLLVLSVPSLRAPPRSGYRPAACGRRLVRALRRHHGRRRAAGPPAHRMVEPDQPLGRPGRA